GVLDGRHVGAMLVSPFDEPAEGYRAVVRDAAAYRIPVSVPHLGEVFEYGGRPPRGVGPVGRVARSRPEPHNKSLVVRVDESGERLLLTGDAEIEEQTEILATDGPGAVKADVLKMPHHGST